MPARREDAKDRQSLLTLGPDVRRRSSIEARVMSGRAVIVEIGDVVLDGADLAKRRCCGA
jgi:hypothetical protein